MILDRKEWREYHSNGQPWIVGEIGIVGELWKHLYDYRLGFKNHEGQPVVRLGVWTKYFENGQLAWSLDFGDGTHGYKSDKHFPSYRFDGTII